MLWRAPDLLSRDTAHALELPKLLSLFSTLAATDLGRDRFAALTPATDRAELDARRARFEEARRLVGDRPLVPSLEGSVRELLERLASGRPPVTGPDLVRLADFLRAAREAKQRVDEADEPGYAALERWLEDLPDLSYLETKIGKALDRRGDVRDDASPDLVTLRRRIRSVRNTLYDELSSYIEEHRDTLAEDTIPLRGGRLVLLLPSGSRGRLSGLTHGRSGTGKSFYFEPLEVIEANNTLQQATDDEEAERQRLMNELLKRAREELPALRRATDRVAELDLLQASVRFATVAEARLPDLAPRHQLELKGARHPLLDPRLADLRRQALGQPGHREPIVPLDLTLSPDQRALVVTGPNAGGKTVALKTTGLLTLAAQCGLPVPVGDGSRLPVFEVLVATIGDEQDLLEDRSTFSGRLLRLKEAWEAAGPDSLLLLDELGSGTDPEEGSALSVALLEALMERRSLAIITTHLTQLAAAALETDGAACAAMEFDADTGEPTFRLLPGPPGGSEALSLARRLGLPAEWLDRAEALLGSEHRELRRLLAEVEQIRRELTATRDRAEREAADAEKLRQRLAEEEKALIEERRTVGKRLRAELDQFRRDTRDRLREEVAKIRERFEAQGRRKNLAEEATRELFDRAPELGEPEPAEAVGPLELGTTVRHRGLGWEGTLEKLDGDRAEVSAKGKRVRLDAEQLVPVTSGPAEKEPRVRVSLVDGTPDVARELLLLGERVEPALGKLDGYLDQALLTEMPEVRVVHGHGSGRLREAVRDHLEGHPAVSKYRPGTPDEGGNGATVVELRR